MNRNGRKIFKFSIRLIMKFKDFPKKARKCCSKMSIKR